MRTVGEILRKARMEKGLTFEDIEKHLRIRKKFLVALEDNNWNKLPSLPYIKGFLRNYSSFLGLAPEEMVAIFRRQFAVHERAGLLPEGVTNPLDNSPFQFTPQMTIISIILLFLFFFFGYLTIQYKTFISPPDIMIEKPKEGEIVGSEKVEVTGKTDRNAVLSINNQKIALSSEGEFSTLLSLPPGVNSITIDSTSKYGKTKTIVRTIQIQENVNND